MEGEQEWEGEESAPTLTLRTRKGKMVNLDAARVEWTAETDRSVYLDSVEGIWKCRHCTWTYRMGSPGIDHAHNHEESFRGLANAKTLSQQGSCFGSQSQQGTASTDENGGTKFSTVGFSAGEKNQGNGEADLETKINGLSNEDNNGSPVDMRAENQLGFNIRYLETANFPSAIESTDKSVAMKFQTNSSKPVVETDVERVLEEQDTHDLYCPNCNSCITRRVILRKRKRKGQDVQFESKREKIEPVLQPDLNASTDTGPDVFRCLACFSFFIPTASGFKLFRIFGRSDEGENLNSPQQIPSKNLNWISSIHEFLKTKKARNEPGNYAVQHVQEDNVQPLGPSKHSNGTLTVQENEILPLIQGGLMLDKSNANIEQSVEGEIRKTLGDKDVILALSSQESLPLGETQIGRVKLDGPIKMNGAVNSIIQRVEDDHPNLTGPSRHSEESLSHEMNDNDSLIQRAVLAEVISFNKEQDRETKIEIVQQKFDGARAREWDILKSIVYGGLIESITSLGVVSSAAGSEAATLNIVALGLANLIGGLFVISHNLKELRNEQRSANDQNVQNLDRYQEILGQRENFWRHVIVAVFSYIIFGLIPPVIYGFSFGKTDNKEYKLIAVAAASLLCIALLAIGKAHVRKAPKTYIKTLLYYVGIGMLASGLSYVVGQLIKKLLEKLGWFDSGAANPVSVFVETRSLRSGWASY